MLIGISDAGSVEETLRMLDKVCRLTCSVLTVDGESRCRANLLRHTLAKWPTFWQLWQSCLYAGH